MSTHPGFLTRIRFGIWNTAEKNDFENTSEKRQTQIPRPEGEQLK
jgi:hypothetical protein